MHFNIRRRGHGIDCILLYYVTNLVASKLAPGMSTKPYQIYIYNIIIIEPAFVISKKPYLFTCKN